jgi:hypothetical protein
MLNPDRSLLNPTGLLENLPRFVPYVNPVYNEYNKFEVGVPMNINYGNQKYCLSNAIGNALNCDIPRDTIDRCIEYLNDRNNSPNVHGVVKVGLLSTHCLNLCVQKLFPGYQLVRLAKDLSASKLLHYLRVNHPRTGIIYGWKSYPINQKKDVRWETICHAVAFRDGYIINDYNYRGDMLRNISNIYTDENCLLRHFQKTHSRYPYSFRFFALEKVSCESVEEDGILQTRKAGLKIRPGKRERLQALQKSAVGSPVMKEFEPKRRKCMN